METCLELKKKLNLQAEKSITEDIEKIKDIWEIEKDSEDKFGKFAFANKELENKELWITLVKYIILFIGLAVGEAITIWLTLRNVTDDYQVNARILYSFISPGFSVIFAAILGGMSYYGIRLKNK